MELRYELTKEDIISFNMYHLKHSPTMKKQYMFLRIAPPVIFILSGIVFLKSSYIHLALFTLLAIIWYFYYEKRYNHYIKKQIDKMLSEEKNNGMIGEQTITITENAITETNSYATSEYKNKFLNKIGENEHYYFLYLSSVTAMIIPKNVFTGDAMKEEFNTMIQKFII